MAKFLQSLNIEVLPVYEKEHAIKKRVETRQALKDFAEGKVSTLEEDPFLMG